MCSQIPEWPSSPVAVRAVTPYLRDGGGTVVLGPTGGTPRGQPVLSLGTPSPVSEMTARAEERAPGPLSVSEEP